MVTLAGQVITGFWVSTTVTVNEQKADSPALFVTVKVLVVMPIGNITPLANPADCLV